MNHKNRQKTGRRRLLFLVVSGMLFLNLNPGFSSDTSKKQTPVARQAGQKVEQSIQIRQKSQKERSRWEQEKTKLTLEYKKLKFQHQSLLEQNQDLTARQTAQQVLNQSLLKKKKESIRIQRELLPFLTSVYDRLELLIKNDPPFLKEERTARLAALEKLMTDSQVSIAEKYRKVMEAVFIEAEYGTTIEVYQDRIVINQEDILGNIFRLGRVSLFFLTLDQVSCAVFNPAEKIWQPLPEEALPFIRSAVEIGSKRRPVELLPLPIGRLAVKEGDQ